MGELIGLTEADVIDSRQQAMAREGEIVLAMIEGEATVKRLYPDGEGARPEADPAAPLRAPAQRGRAKPRGPALPAFA